MPEPGYRIDRPRAGQVQIADPQANATGGAGMWGRRKRRCAKLSRQLALGMLEDAMARAEERQRPPEAAVSSPGAVVSSPGAAVGPPGAAVGPAGAAAGPAGAAAGPSADEKPPLVPRPRRSVWPHGRRGRLTALAIGNLKHAFRYLSA
jgi:hypothetical protein